MIACLLHAASLVAAQDTTPAPESLAPASASAEPAEKGLVVREVVILLQDAFRDSLSERDLFDNSLPAFVLQRRRNASGEARHAPSPVGLMTFAAPPGEAPETVSVELDLKSGRFFSAWPLTDVRGNKVTWEAMQVAEGGAKEGSDGGDAELSEDHWLSSLRTADRLWLDAGRRADRFLLYDLEMGYPLPLDADRTGKGSERYVLKRSNPPAALDVALLRRRAMTDEAEGAGWTIAAEPLMAEPTTRATGDPAAAKKVTTYTVQQGDTMQSIAQKLYGDQNVWPELWKINRQQAPRGPNQLEVGKELKLPDRPILDGLPGPEPLKLDGKPTPLPAVDGDFPDVDAAAAGVVDRWSVLGLDEPELAVARRVLAEQLRKADGAVIVYRLPRLELDARLPVTIEPAPARHTRLGIVILHNADPELDDRIEAMIEQLGAATWAERDAATQALEAYGEAATAKLKAALRNPDAEIAHRADLLLTGFEAQSQ